MSRNPNNLTHWLWFDFETTGLWLIDDEPPALMQLGCVLLPFGDLDPDHAMFAVEWEFYISDDDVEDMDDVAREMHTSSGLIDRCRASSVTVGSVARQLMRRLSNAGVMPIKCAMAGTGIAPFDVPLLRLYMPSIYSFMHYAPYDLGTGRRMLTSIVGYDLGSNMPDSGADHTALADVYAMLEQARWLRAEMRRVFGVPIGQVAT